MDGSSATHAVAAAAAETAVEEHVCHTAGQAWIGADCRPEIISIAPGLSVSLSAGFNGIQQGTELIVIRRHPDGRTRVIQSRNAISKPKICPRIQCVPVRVVGRDPVQRIHRVVETI